MNKESIHYMKLALQLAWLAKGKTSPNPSVGAVVVKNSKIISVGHTNPPGLFHAERMALLHLSDEESNGATLYVTLEPCCFQGRTPPCTDIIIQKKIKKVFVATLDPHPNVSGKGIEILRKNGILVEVGLLEQKAMEINRDFFIWAKEGRPLITLKYAMTLDGKMATLSGDSKWITNERARKTAHILRYRSDAILVGVNTVIKDNPLLNARLNNRGKRLLRIILDPAGRTPKNSIVMEDDLSSLFVFKKDWVDPNLIQYLKTKNNKEVYLDENAGREINLNQLVLYLGKKGITSLFVEGGANVLGSFLKQRLGDKIFSFIGNQILGEGLSPFHGFRNSKMKDAVRVEHLKIKKLDDNFLIYGDLVWEK